jgi:hypothetical protein
MMNRLFQMLRSVQAPASLSARDLHPRRPLDDDIALDPRRQRHPSHLRRAGRLGRIEFVEDVAFRVPFDDVKAVIRTVPLDADLFADFSGRLVVGLDFMNYFLRDLNTRGREISGSARRVILTENRRGEGQRGRQSCEQTILTMFHNCAVWTVEVEVWFGSYFLEIGPSTARFTARDEETY